MTVIEKKRGEDMAKAFTEEERLEIRERIMETAIDLFHENGAKALSIQELTRRVGISQGSFYNFWKDKESLIIDVMCYRSTQKLNDIEKIFSHSLSNPVQFLTDVICEYSIDIVMKIQTKQIYRDSFQLFEKSEDKRMKQLYVSFLNKLVSFWESNSAIKSANLEGLYNTVVGSSVLCSNYNQFDEVYFEEILRTYLSHTISRYLQV